MHQQLGRKRAPTEGRGQFQIDERVDPCRARRDVAATDRGRERLREAADLDDPLQPVEGGQPRGRTILEIGENVVLDDQQVMRLGQPQDAVTGDGRDHRAGRIVRAGVGDVEPWPVLLERGFEGVEVGSVRGTRHTDGLDPVGAEEREEVEVARIVDQHLAAGLEQKPADEVERLGPALGQHDLVRMRLDATVGHPHGQQVAQLGQTQRRAILGQPRLRQPRQAAQRAPDLLLRHPAARQPATARVDADAPAVERLPGDPQRVDLPRHGRAAVAQRKGRQMSGHVEPGAAARLDHAFGHQPVVGLDHRRA